jgi:hypothetical protein
MRERERERELVGVREETEIRCRVTSHAPLNSEPYGDMYFEINATFMDVN